MAKLEALPQGSGSLDADFGHKTPRQQGLEEWNEPTYGNIIVTGFKKQECQDRVVICPRLLDKTVNTKEKLQQFLGFIPKRLSLFAIFDGHGGDDCSNFLGMNVVKQFWKCCSDELDTLKQKDVNILLENVMKTLCINLEKLFKEKCQRVGRRDGSCGTICLVWDKKLVCANVGDSRSMIRNNGALLALTEDHKPSNPKERQRLVALNEQVIIDSASGEERLKTGLIAITRAFGNLPVKDISKALIAEPDVKLVEITETMEFLLMASDGIWCRLSSEEALTLVKGELAKNDENCHEAAKALAREARKRGTNDDCSIIVALLNQE
jgi:serine/threonine protein phosphatase PrpC